MSSEFNFNSTVSVDSQTGELLAVYLRIRQGRVASTEEVAEGAAFADYDESGQLLGVEMIAPCRVAVLDRIARAVPSGAPRKRVREFLRRTIPVELAEA